MSITRFKLVLVAFFVILGAFSGKSVWAGPVNFKPVGTLPGGMDTIVKCVGLLISLTNVEPIAPETQSLIHVGTIGDLDELLNSSGVTQEDRSFLQLAVNVVISKTEEPLIKKILNRLGTSQDQLLVCIADKSCRMNDRFASLSSAQWMGEEAIFMRDSKMRALAPDAQIKEDNYSLVFDDHKLDLGRDSGGMRILTLPNGSPRMDVNAYALWISAFFHELMHFEDTFLVRDWIENNLRSPKRHDPLFQRFTRIIDNKVVVSSDFYQVLLEARAYSVMAGSLRPVLSSPEALKAFHRQMRTRCYRYLLNFVGSEFLAGLNVTEENIFEIWEDWIDQMNLSSEFK